MRLQGFYEIETDNNAVSDELNRLLAAKRFAGAPMMSAFLRYIVTQKLEGHAIRIKAYTIGVDALGKPDSFDAQLDPSVRVLALRLRKALKSVYETDPTSSVRIDLKVGTYVPEFYKVGTDAIGSNEKVPAYSINPSVRTDV